MLGAGNPVAFFANALGDHLLNLPALRALSMLFQDRLTLVTCRCAGADLLQSLPVRKVFQIAAPHTEGGRTFDARALAGELGEVDCFLSLNPWHSAVVEELLHLLRPAESVGFFAGFQTVLPLDFSKHSADLAFDVVRYLDRSLRLEDFAWPPAIPARTAEFARAIRAKCGRPLLVVHAETKRDKSWKPDRMAKAISAFSDMRNYECVIVGRHAAAVDLDIASAAIPALNLPLASAIALIGEANLFLGVDSFPLHAADLSRIPGVGLFGPTNPDEFGFRFSPIHKHIRKSETLESIPVDDVLEALIECDERTECTSAPILSAASSLQ